jgi:hypothetical protein
MPTLIFYGASSDAKVGKIGRIASEEVLCCNFFKTNFVPVSIYSLELCDLAKSVLRSLDFL